MFKKYYALTKPGIVRGNLLTAAGGFLWASGTAIDWWFLLVVLAAEALVMASGCVFNNYIDRDIDRRMERTKQRSIVTGAIPVRHALVFGTVLGVAGIILLALATNAVAVTIGIVGFILYVFVYAVAKRKTVHGTLVGSLSGAIAPVVGYTAVSGRIDAAAVLLFLAIALWQMPHFYSIALFRSKDYKAAGIPVLPLVYGRRTTQWYILAYIVLFTLACLSMSVVGVAGITFALLMTAYGTYWLAYGVRGLHMSDDVRWAKGMFGISLLGLIILSAGLVADTWLP